MRGLDTGVLVDLLHGRPAARSLLEESADEELCTTEVNLFELEAIARGDRRAGRERRLAALDRLRRKITVLPIDERAVHAAALLAAAHPRSASTAEYLILGAAEAAGVREWVSDAPLPVPSPPARLKVRAYGGRNSK